MKQHSRVQEYKKGDLVHIPQAVVLIDWDSNQKEDLQLTIPLRVAETEVPKVGIVTSVSPSRGYVKVFCDGSLWSVKDTNIYSLTEEGVL